MNGVWFLVAPLIEWPVIEHPRLAVRFIATVHLPPQRFQAVLSHSCDENWAIFIHSLLVFYSSNAQPRSRCNDRNLVFYIDVSPLLYILVSILANASPDHYTEGRHTFAIPQALWHSSWSMASGMSLALNAWLTTAPWSSICPCIS